MQYMKRTVPYILAIVLMAIVAVLFFAPDDLQGHVLQQHDILQGLANGHETQLYAAATGHSPRWTNALFGGMPTFQISPSYTANSLLGWFFSVYTLWLPSPANLLFAMCLGFFLMCLCMKFRWTTSLFAAIAWGFSTYFIIIIGAGHIWKFITLSYIPPTIGGLALIFRRKYLAGTAMAALFGALQLQGNHPQMTYYFCFLVLFMLIAWGISAWKGGKTRQFGYGLGCTVAAALLALGVNSASLYNSYEYSKETVRGRATDLPADPSAQTGGMDRDALTAWSYGIDESFTLLIPNVKGGASLKPTGGSNRMLSVTDTEAADGIYLSPEERAVAQQFTQYFGDQPMTNGPVYVGALVLALALLALITVRGRVATPMKWALFAGAMLSLFLSWGHNFEALSDFFIDHVPGYNKFRTPSSILVVLEFCVPLLAAMVLRQMLDTPDWLHRHSRASYVSFGLPAVICLLGAVWPGVFGSPYSTAELEMLRGQEIFTNPAYANVLTAISESRLSLVRGDSVRSLLYLVAGGLVCWLYLRGAFRNRNLFIGALTAVMLIDLFSVNRRYVDSDNFVEPLPQTESFAESAADREIMKDTSVYRVLDLQDFDGARSSYFHHTVGGYHAAKLTRYNDLITHLMRTAMQRMMQTAASNAARLQTLEQDSAAIAAETDTRLFTEAEPVFDMLNAKYFLYGDYVEENPGALGNAWFVDRVTYVDGAEAEMDAIRRLNPATEAVADKAFADVIGQAAPKAPGDTIYLTSYAPDRLTYRTRTASERPAVFSEIYFPWGWTATVDGTEVPIGRADYTLRALRIPAGEHEVVMEFRPTSLDVTNRLGVASVIGIFILCAAAVAVPFHKRRRK